MDKLQRKQLAIGALLVLALVAVVVWIGYNRPSQPPPASTGYYSGPIRSKGHPNLFVTADGKVVPPPPGVHLVDKAQSNPGGVHQSPPMPGAK